MSKFTYSPPFFGESFVLMQNVSAGLSFALITAFILFSVSGESAGAGTGTIVTDDLFDAGDAPDAAQSGFANSYPTLAVDNGARHTATGLTLGATRDAEADGQPRWHRG